MGSSLLVAGQVGVSCRSYSAGCDTKITWPVWSSFVIVLTDPEHRELSGRARWTRTAHRDRVRARIVLAAAQGEANTAIAGQAGVCVDTRSASGVGGSPRTG
jgi:hypothetical protein